MAAASTARRVPPSASNLPERAMKQAPGPTRPATCGCSAAMATTQPASAGYLNDLWRYSPSTGQWTWVGGGNVDNAAGVYGTPGTAAAGNVPGARYSASSWIDCVRQLVAVRRLWLRLNRRYRKPQRSVAIQSEHRAVDLGQRWQLETTPPASTARRPPPRPATCRERAIRPAPGSTLRATCGCSAAWAMTRPAPSET